MVPASIKVAWLDSDVLLLPPSAKRAVDTPAVSAATVASQWFISPELQKFSTSQLYCTVCCITVQLSVIACQFSSVLLYKLFILLPHAT